MAAAGGGGGGQGQSDNSMGFLWIIVAIFAAGLLIWYAGHDIIVAIFFKIKIFEINLISLFTSGLQGLKQQILATDPAAVDINSLGQLLTLVGNYLKIPVAIVLAALAIVLYNTSAKTRFRTTFSMKTLQSQEKENWPQITPTIKLDLINEDINKGPWAMSMTPMQFAKKYKLLKEEMKAVGSTGLNKDQQITVSLIRNQAYRVFSRQLGAPWGGVERLKIHARALFAIFVAKSAGDRKASDALVRQIAASAETSRLDFSGADDLVKKHMNSKIVKKVVNNHAYELTVMASLLELARMDGVLASAEFLWLKPLDRPLWYMLNTVGRRVAPVEVGAPFAHWLAEREIGHRLTIPMIDEAVNALEASLGDILYKRDEEDDEKAA